MTKIDMEIAGTAPPVRRRVRRAAVALWVASGMALVATATARIAFAQVAVGTPQPRLETITLSAGMHAIRAEVALTPAQRSAGLMFRRDLGPNDAMLFVFESPNVQCFWMRNTPTPLTIAYLADDGTVVNLLDMAPFDESSHCSDKPVRYALEMNKGWFAKRGIKPGFKVRGAPFGG